MKNDDFKGAFGRLEEKEDTRWGKYLVFKPNSLPPEINYNANLINHLSRSNHLLGKLSGIGQLLPNPDLLITPYLRKEAVMSSRIEGTRISLSDLLLFEADGSVEEEPDALEVTNYIRSVKFGLEKIGGSPIDLDLITDMHAILMKGVRGEDRYPGEYRKVQNWIGPPGSRVSDALFIPPAPEDVLMLMEDLIRYLNTDDGVPLLVKCALMHYQFETIHPFCDGNGRMGRTLITLYLCKKNLLSKPLLYLSGFFEVYKREYSSLLLMTNRGGMFEDWIDFFLRAVAVQAENAIEKTSRTQQLREGYRALALKNNTSSSLIRMIDILFLNPYIRVSDVQKKIEITYPTAKKVVEELLRLKILSPADEARRDRLYVASEILAVIND